MQRGTGWADHATRCLSARPIAWPTRPTALAADRSSRTSATSASWRSRPRSSKTRLRRIGRITLDAPIAVVGIAGRRLSHARAAARAHGRIGFFREGTHSLCDAGADAPAARRHASTCCARSRRAGGARARHVSRHRAVGELDASERALHLELVADGDPSRLATIDHVEGLTGVSCAPPESRGRWSSGDRRSVTDTHSRRRRSTRHARSFFQGNRFLLEPLVDHVLSHVGDGPVLDLYAGVGLFSVTRRGGRSRPGHGDRRRSLRGGAICGECRAARRSYGAKRTRSRAT